MKTVVLSGAARQALLDEAHYLRERNPRAALTFERRMRDARDLLSAHPEAGRSIDSELFPKVRRLVVDS